MVPRHSIPHWFPPRPVKQELVRNPCCGSKDRSCCPEECTDVWQWERKKEGHYNYHGCEKLAWYNFCGKKVEDLTGMPDFSMKDTFPFQESYWLDRLSERFEHVTDMCCKTCASGDICKVNPLACTTDPEMVIKAPLGITINHKTDTHIPLKGFLPTQLGTIADRLVKRNESGEAEKPQLLLIFASDEHDALSGTVPSEIGRLHEMHAHYHAAAMDPFSLKRTGNRLSGTVPTEIGRVCQVTATHLHLTGGSVSGTIPTEIGNFRFNSCHFHLGVNRLSGFLPTELGMLSDLTEFIGLHSNSISGTLPTELGRMTSLEEVWLHDNKISGTLPTQLALMAATRDVRLAHNRLSGTAPSELVALRTHAAHVDLGGNFFSGTLPSGLTSFSASVSEFGFFLPRSYATRDHHQPVCVLNAGDIGFDIECGDVRWPTACAGACWTQATALPYMILLGFAGLVVLTASWACRATAKSVDVMY